MSLKTESSGIKALEPSNDAGPLDMVRTALLQLNVLNDAENSGETVPQIRAMLEVTGVCSLNICYYSHDCDKFVFYRAWKNTWKTLICLAVS
jgi:hypothetical protein